MRRRALVVFIYLASAGCFDPPASSDTDGGSSGTTSGPIGVGGSSGSGPFAETGSSDETGSSGETGPPSSTGTTTGTNDDTGGCSPGVFGQSNFDNACFQ